MIFPASGNTSRRLAELRMIFWELPSEELYTRFGKMRKKTCAVTQEF
ncbi:hypothetical protein LptCag_1154 [Leptospirillum ferriphilum]|uniref:Uncharacterized protein n=1 Tax=Leptospirillum ferriphilum TaxID=178606 RepID=A0A094YMC1_9BACT|nr:hypothetical protein LptCag_1154 [Leptospirillum ferriphilum]